MIQKKQTKKTGSVQKTHYTFPLHQENIQQNLYNFTLHAFSFF